jgi:hypothetical protein
MAGIDVAAIERIIAKTINETARGDPEALASRIVAALAEAGYRIAPVNLAEDTALGRQPFDELTPEMRPRDTYGDGRGWTFRTGEHGATSPTTCPRPSRRPMRRGVRRSMSRSPVAARSWSPAHIRQTVAMLPA